MYSYPGNVVVICHVIDTENNWGMPRRSRGVIRSVLPSLWGYVYIVSNDLNTGIGRFQEGATTLVVSLIPLFVFMCTAPSPPVVSGCKIRCSDKLLLARFVNVTKCAVACTSLHKTNITTGKTRVKQTNKTKSLSSAKL